MAFIQGIYQAVMLKMPGILNPDTGCAGILDVMTLSTIDKPPGLRELVGDIW
jgi:hypothetical protein